MSCVKIVAALLAALVLNILVAVDCEFKFG